MRYNLDRPHVFVSSPCARAKGAGGLGWTQKALLINLSVQQSPQKTHTLILVWFTWAPKILWRSCLPFCLAAPLCLWGSRVEHEQWATPPLNQPPDTQKSSAWYCSVNSKQHLNNTNEKQYGFTRGGAGFIVSTGYITAHISSQVSGKMLMHSLSIIAALTSFIVKPDESTGRVHSYIHLRGAPGSSRLPVIVSDRQMTSAWPRAALGMRHLFLIKQNKGGLWWYHMRVAPPPHTLPLSHDRRLPFPSNRVSVSLLCV